MAILLPLLQALTHAADGGSNLTSWEPGYTCPAGAYNYDPAESYGVFGFDWIGDEVDPGQYPDHDVGNPQACCWDGGGDGANRDGPKPKWIGLWYSMCNPKLGCTDTDKAYTCSIYANVTGRKPAPGVLAGRAQSPAGAVLEPAKVSAGATEYANPYAGPCKGKALAFGYDSVNVSKIEVGAPPGFFRVIPGATCAPACGCRNATEGAPDCNGHIVACPTTGLPVNTTATPQCMVGAAVDDPMEFLNPSVCVLVCDPSDPSGTGGPTSKCPRGATCQPMYGREATVALAVYDTGVCLYGK